MRIVARSVPAGPMVQSDQILLNGDQERISSYSEVFTQPIFRRESILADEGTYYTANNAQTAITGPAGNAFSSTLAALLIQNNNPASNTVPKRIIPLYIHLEAGGTAFTAASAELGLFFALTVDTVARFSSGGTALTLVNNNPFFGNNSLALIQAGAVTLTAATAARTIIGQRILRLPVSSTTAASLINVDTYHFTFGSVENGSQTLGNSATLNAFSAQNTFNLPGISIPPGMSMMLHIWNNCTTPAAGNLIYEVGYAER